MSNVCIYCGAEIPEGIIVCPACLEKYFFKEGIDK